MGFIRDKKATAPLTDLLENDEHEGVRISAVQVLGVLGDKSVYKPLLAQLEEGTPRIQGQVIRSLGKLEVVESAGPLSEFVDRTKDKKLKIYALEALGRIKSADGERTLEKASKDKDIEIATLKRKNKNLEVRLTELELFVAQLAQSQNGGIK